MFEKPYTWIWWMIERGDCIAKLWSILMEQQGMDWIKINSRWSIESYDNDDYMFDPWEQLDKAIETIAEVIMNDASKYTENEMLFYLTGCLMWCSGE